MDHSLRSGTSYMADVCAARAHSPEQDGGAGQREFQAVQGAPDLAALRDRARRATNPANGFLVAGNREQFDEGLRAWRCLLLGARDVGGYDARRTIFEQAGFFAAS